jgi:hypothetical protein
MIDLSKTRFIVTDWPDRRWPVNLIGWIEDLTRDLEVRRDYRLSNCVKGMVPARNTAIRDALRSHPHYEHFIFVDHDVQPGSDTTRFLELESDLKCCQVPQQNKTAYAWPDDFHDALWCINRDALEKIEPPWFTDIPLSSDGTRMLGCVCQTFKQRVLDSGLTIAHGGWAEHDRDDSWC